jgi:hypothetical protein
MTILSIEPIGFTILGPTDPERLMMAEARKNLIKEDMPAAFVLQMGTNGLGVARSLGREGVRVVGVDFDPRALGFYSRCCQPVLCPEPIRGLSANEAIGRPDPYLNYLELIGNGEIVRNNPWKCPVLQFPILRTDLARKTSNCSESTILERGRRKSYIASRNTAQQESDSSRPLVGGQYAGPGEPLCRRDTETNVWIRVLEGQRVLLA